MKATTEKAVERKRVFLVDDHTILREGLATLINQSADLEVCGEASTAEEALAKVASVQPHAIVVDLSLPDTGGLELLRLLKLRHPEIPTLVLSMHDEAVYAKRALRAGAKGYIMKHEAITEVQAAIRRILEGGLYLSRKVSDWLVQSAVQSRAGRDTHPVNGLSDREFEVFEMIGKGLGTSEIARQLHLSVKTIETYQAKLKEKLNLADAQKLFQFALRWVEGR